KRQHRGARVEMVERLLLDGIDAEPRRPAVGRQDHRIVLALAHEAGAALALVQLAFARAQVALDAAIRESLPPAAGMLVAHGSTVSSTNLRTWYLARRTSGPQ